MEVKLTRHVLEKLESHLRYLGVSREDIASTVEEPDEVLYDVCTGRYVALSYSKNLAVVYERRGDDVVVVTAIYSSRLRSLVERRRRAGRWI